METPQIVRPLPPGFRLFKGGHQPPVEGQPLELCLDEAVAWMFGERHTASPACMSPTLAGHGMRLNDRFDDDERQLLVRLLPLLGGTRSTPEVERRRSFVLVDAAIREIAPMGLAAVKWIDLADRMRTIPLIADTASARAASAICADIRTEAKKRRAAAYAYADYAYDAADAAADAADDDAAAADYAAAAAYAAADAAAAADYAAAAAAYADARAASPEERVRIRAAARRPIVLASIAAFERAIGIR